jgi:hypothetical protein
VLGFGVSLVLTAQLWYRAQAQGTVSNSFRHCTGQAPEVQGG